jgi:hypothetical protein
VSIPFPISEKAKIRTISELISVINCRCFNARVGFFWRMLGKNLDELLEEQLFLSE